MREHLDRIVVIFRVKLRMHVVPAVFDHVSHGVNGLVSEPRPQALADAFDALWADRARAEEMGAAHAGRIGELNISWDHVVERLLA